MSCLRLLDLRFLVLCTLTIYGSHKECVILEVIELSKYEDHYKMEIINIRKGIKEIETIKQCKIQRKDLAVQKKIDS